MSEPVAICRTCAQPISTAGPVPDLYPFGKNAPKPWEPDPGVGHRILEPKEPKHFLDQWWDQATKTWRSCVDGSDQIPGLFYRRRITPKDFANESATGKWWCSRCERRVHGGNVSIGNLHLDCGGTCTVYIPEHEPTRPDAIPSPKQPWSLRWKCPKCGAEDDQGKFDQELRWRETAKEPPTYPCAMKTDAGCMTVFETEPENLELWTLWLPIPAPPVSPKPDEAEEAFDRWWAKSFPDGQTP